MKTPCSLAARETHADGFTLTDLLATAMILGIVAALFLPALAGTEPKSQAVRCIENQRRLAQAWQMYAVDNGGVFPLNSDQGHQPSSPSDTSDPQWCPGNQGSSQAVDQAWIEAGQIYPYVKSLAVYRCPSDISTFPASGPLAKPRTRSVSMNCWIGTYGPWNSNYRVYYKNSDLSTPGAANLFLIMDENPNSINDAYFVVDPAGRQWIDYPASYHNSGAGISFCDGHATIKKWSDKAVLYVMADPPSVSPSPIICPDLPWLQTHSTLRK